MYKKGLERIAWLLVGSAACGTAAEAQLPNPYREISEPGIVGARIHPGALAPAIRKWYLPQNLYYEYRWRGWEYSNYAREAYQRYVGTLLNGERLYDPLGNYIARGWEIYDWTETNPRSFGSSLFKSPRFNSWFSNVIVSSASKGQFHTAVTLGDAIRTTLTPMTFSKPAFNGIQWDFLSDKYAATFLGSRVSAPGSLARTQLSSANTTLNSTRVLGGRGVAQVGDFGKVGITWVNAHHADSELSLDDNSLKGVLTRPQNQGNVEEVVIRISDDSPESPEEGAVLFLERILIDGEVQDKIVPLVEGGVQEDGVLKAKGTDAILLTYDIRNDFELTETTPTYRDAEKLEFELILANDYRVEVTSNKQVTSLGGPIFLPVAHAESNITDGSNQHFLRFEYGLPTANEILGVDFNVTDIKGFDLSTEYAINRRFQRFPNQNFRKLPATEKTSEAFYLTASYVRYPFFGYGETFYLDPEYSTAAYMADGSGNISYDQPFRHLFEFVDDNDDQDQTPDWLRSDQGGANVLFAQLASTSGGDREVFPGLDENNDFIPDFNQNKNDKPDYAEAFLRYRVDSPEFLFGMDVNNNTITDRFEDDLQADLPYERDRSGYNVYGGLAFREGTNLTVGRLRQRQISSGRENHATYALLTSEWDYPGLQIAVFELGKQVRDNIFDDRIVWTDPDGMVPFNDPLDAQDTFINSFYTSVKYNAIARFHFTSKLKYERYFQQGNQAELKADRSFLGAINKFDYQYPLSTALTLSPKFKSTFRNRGHSDLDLRTSRDHEGTVFLLARYSLLDKTWVDFGVEFSKFDNAKETVQAGEEGDFDNFVWAVLVSNTSAYIGYNITLNAGFKRERKKFKDADDPLMETIAFMRVFAATGEL